MMEIPKDIRDGKSTLEHEIPWIAPDAIRELDKILQKGMTVLEFGSGGSTLFFSKRCLSVLSFESDLEWINKLSKIILEKNYTNVTIKHFLDDKIEIPDSHYDCIMIDNSWKIVSRDKILDMCLTLSPSILVLDNFRSKRAFPSNYKLSTKEFTKKYNFKNYLCKDYKLRSQVTRCLINFSKITE